MKPEFGYKTTCREPLLLHNPYLPFDCHLLKHYFLEQTSSCHCSVEEETMVNSYEKIQEALKKAQGPATILAIGTANPPNTIYQADYPDYYFRVTNSEHMTLWKDKFKRICKYKTKTVINAASTKKDNKRIIISLNSISKVCKEIYYKHPLLKIFIFMRYHRNHSKACDDKH